MGFVKAIVIGMGVLIVAGFIIVAVTLVIRMQGAAEPDSAYRTTLSLPNGTAITETSMVDGEVLLRLKAADGASWLMIIDARTGAEKGRIKLLPGAP
jgi:hypothetical protein